VILKRRNYGYTQLNAGDMANRCISSATACLYGITEAAVLTAGYAPAIGFIHTGKPLPFVYDIADLFKFDKIIPHGTDYLALLTMRYDQCAPHPWG
jgi:CRISPR-associated protein Cas1